jgi:hypothetical protein
LVPLLHPLITIEPPVSKPHRISTPSSFAFRILLRNPRIPTKLPRSTGHPKDVANAALDCPEIPAGRIADEVAVVGITPGPTSVQRVTPTVCAAATPGTGVKVSEVGVTVQTEFAGKPEQAKVTAPFSVLVGTTVTLASAVDPCAVPTLKEPTGARVVGEIK